MGREQEAERERNCSWQADRVLNSHPVSVDIGHQLISHEDLPTDLIHGAGASKERLQRQSSNTFTKTPLKLLDANYCITEQDKNN